MNNEMPRRDFLERLLAAGVVLQGGRSLAAEEQTTSSLETTATEAAKAPEEPKRKIKIGLVGCGGRGNWIAGLFRENGGYEFAAVADYFPATAEKVGEALGVPAERRFSGLSGYLKVIESGIEAIVLQTPPYFFPKHAEAAVAAGLHVYMAKPVAVDVPGTLLVGKLGEKSTKAQKVFFVDYQMRTDPINIEVEQKVREGALGKLRAVWSCGMRDDKAFNDPPLTENLESRLQNLIWVNDVVLGGGYHVNFDIHVMDALLWLIGKRPVSAYGHAERCRPKPHGDTTDNYTIVYKCEDGLPWYHQAGVGPGHDWLNQGQNVGSVQGDEAAARVSYDQTAYIRGGKGHMGPRKVEGLYGAGVQRNIATFYKKVTSDNFGNETVPQAVDGALTTILGREASRRGELLTMEQLIRENTVLEADLKGLKA